VVALLGENGAGKTTLMNILFGHYTADEGTVEAFGKSLPPGDPRAALEAGVGMVHQHFTLADHLTVLENIALGTQPLWSPRFGRRGRARARWRCRRFRPGGEPDARVADLSVGERQRVEILKALYRDARILILDEPTAVLTPLETEALFATLKKLVANGLSIIFISHKLNEVMAVSDRVLVLRGGKLAASGGRRRRRAGTGRTDGRRQLPVNEVGPPNRRQSACFELRRIDGGGVGGGARSTRSTRCNCAAVRSPGSPAFPAMARRRWRR
jgi:ABC-type uncharacterized transport system ATPase subunit